LLVPLLLAVLTAGCGRLPASQNRAAAALPRAFDRLNSLERQRENQVIQTAKTVPGVEDASCYIQEGNALVGLLLKGSLFDKDLLALKAEVERVVKQEDGTLTHVAVTITPELQRRIADLSGDGKLEGRNPMAADDKKKLEEFMAP